MRCCEAPQNGLTCGFSAGAAGQRFYGTFTRTKNERQTRRLGWDSLMSRSDRCKRSSGAAAATGGGHFSQHSVKLPPQGQVSGEIGPRGLGNGGFREFHVEIRPGRGGQKSAQWASKPPHRRGASVRATRCRRRRSRAPQQCGMVPGLHASQAHSLHRRPRRPASSVRSRRWQGGTTPS